MERFIETLDSILEFLNQHASKNTKVEKLAKKLKRYDILKGIHILYDSLKPLNRLLEVIQTENIQFSTFREVLRC